MIYNLCQFLQNNIEKKFIKKEFKELKAKFSLDFLIRKEDKNKVEKKGLIKGFKKISLMFLKVLISKDKYTILHKKRRFYRKIGVKKKYSEFLDVVKERSDKKMYGDTHEYKFEKYLESEKSEMAAIYNGFLYFCGSEELLEIRKLIKEQNKIQLDKLSELKELEDCIKIRNLSELRDYFLRHNYCFPADFKFEVKESSVFIKNPLKIATGVQVMDFLLNWLSNIERSSKINEMCLRFKNANKFENLKNCENTVESLKKYVNSLQLSKIPEELNSGDILKFHGKIAKDFLQEFGFEIYWASKDLLKISEFSKGSINFKNLLEFISIIKKNIRKDEHLKELEKVENIVKVIIKYFEDEKLKVIKEYDNIKLNVENFDKVDLVTFNLMKKNYLQVFQKFIWSRLKNYIKFEEILASLEEKSPHVKIETMANIIKICHYFNFSGSAFECSDYMEGFINFKKFMESHFGRGLRDKLRDKCAMECGVQVQWISRANRQNFLKLEKLGNFQKIFECIAEIQEKRSKSVVEVFEENNRLARKCSFIFKNDLLKNDIVRDFEEIFNCIYNHRCKELEKKGEEKES